MGSNRREQVPIGLACVEECSDPVVGEVEPERCPLDAFDQVVEGFGGFVVTFEMCQLAICGVQRAMVLPSLLISGGRDSSWRSSASRVGVSERNGWVSMS